jgi:hypothetical protein
MSSPRTGTTTLPGRSTQLHYLSFLPEMSRSAAPARYAVAADISQLPPRTLDILLRNHFKSRSHLHPVTASFEILRPTV